MVTESDNVENNILYHVDFRTIKTAYCPWCLEETEYVAAGKTNLEQTEGIAVGMCKVCKRFWRINNKPVRVNKKFQDIDLY